MIDPISGALLNEGLAAITSAMTGSSMATEYDARMDKTYSDASGITIGYGNYTDDKPAITGQTGNSIVDSTEDTAQEAWQDWMHDNPDSVSGTTGGAVIGSDASTFNYSLMENNDEEIEAVAPVAVEKDAVIVAISQALGLSMKLSDVDPIFAGKLSNALVATGMIYSEADNLVTAWKDANDNILIPKAIVDAFKDIFDEEEIGQAEGYSRDVDTNVDGTTITAPVNYALVPSHSRYRLGGPTSSGGDYVLDNNTNYDLKVTIINGVLLTCKQGTQTVAADSVVIRRLNAQGGTTSSTFCSPSETYTFSSNGVAWKKMSLPSVSVTGPLTVPVSNGTDSRDNYAKKLGWVMWYMPAQPVGGYPEGTQESLAPAYTPADLVAGGVAKARDQLIPVCAVNLPTTPYDTTESTVDPDSSTDPNRVKELPAPPIPVPVPDTRPSNPEIGLSNPSKVDEEVAKKVDELVEDLANTVDPMPPQSSGISPLPYMPGTPVYDPTTGEQTGTSYPSIVPSSGSGLIHVYNPTPAEFVSFGQWLWVTYADATIDKIWNNPFDGIIGAFELYSTPSTDGTDNIRSGFLVCPTTAKLVRQRYTEINCGTVVVPEFYGNYLDYSPYSQCYIYLPFIGINEVSIDDIVGHAVNIRYRVDAYNGSCIAMIYVAKDGYENLCYQFAGNCGVEVPLAGGSQAAIKAGMMQAEAYGRAAVQSAQIQKTASIGTGIVNGASAGAGAGAMNPVAGIVGGLLGALAGGTSGYIQGSADYGAAKLNAGAMQEAARVANKSSVQHSGSFGSSHGAMGNKVPFLIIRNPIQVKVVNYNDDYGFPAHKRVIIGGCTGYLRVREVNVISAFATNEEKIAIEQALKEGVYVT